MPDPSANHNAPQFDRLAGMVEGRLLLLLEEIEKQAIASDMEELAKLCRRIVDKTAPPLCCSPYRHPDPGAVLKQYRYCIPHPYRFATDHARRLSESLPEFSWRDELFFRLAVFLPYMEAEAKGWAFNFQDGATVPDLGKIVERLYEMDGLLRVWDGFYKGGNYFSRPTLENPFPLPDFNFFEDAALTLLEVQDMKRLSGAIATKHKGEATKRRILSTAFEIDPEKKQPASELSCELEAGFRVNRKTKMAYGNLSTAKDTSYTQRGFKKANIQRVLLKNGWKNVKQKRLCFLIA